MSNFFVLLFEFFKTGLFAVGGGLATIPFLQEMIGKYGWFSESMLATMIAVSESTPGPMGINMATYTGFLVDGVLGGIVTTMSLVAPSIIIIIIVAKMLDKFKESQLVKDVFYGIRPAVVGFIMSACMTIFLLTLAKVDAFNVSKNIVDLFNYVNIGLVAVIYFIYKKFKPHPILIIVSCALLGIVFKLG